VRLIVSEQQEQVPLSTRGFRKSVSHRLCQLSPQQVRIDAVSLVTVQFIHGVHRYELASTADEAHALTTSGGNDPCGKRLRCMDAAEVLK
jgi:hypothetical protein